MSEADIYSALLGRLTRDRAFFGVVDEAGRTLQIMYEATGDRYWVETPEPERHGSYGRKMTFDEVVDLLKALPAAFTPDAISGLAFEPW